MPCSSSRRSTHRAPPSCAPVKSEGDLWGDLNTVGRATGSPLLLLVKNPTQPQPLPVMEGALPTPRPPVGGGEVSPSERISFQGHQDGVPADLSTWRFTMAFVRVEQRNAHLASNIRLDYVNGREGRLAKAVVTAISNHRRGSGDAREEEATSIQWTLWGPQAENAAEYLGKGSHVNIVGRLRNNNYEKEGETVYGLAFTVEEIDYLDSKADADARRSGQNSDAPATKPDAPAKPTCARRAPAA